MDGFGDMLGGLGDLIGGIFGGEAGVEGAMGLADMLSPEGRDRDREAAPAIVYERYLCGAPRQLHINDR